MQTRWQCNQNTIANLKRAGILKSSPLGKNKYFLSHVEEIERTGLNTQKLPSKAELDKLKAEIKRLEEEKTNLLTVNDEISTLSFNINGQETKITKTPVSITIKAATQKEPKTPKRLETDDFEIDYNKDGYLTIKPK